MFFNFSRLRVVRVPLVALLVWVAVATTSGCTAHERLVRRNTAEAPGLSWFSPTAHADQASLARWAHAVGPPVIATQDSANLPPSSGAQVTLATWNVAVGEGDVSAFVADLRRDNPDRPFVLLLQEAYRDGPNVPSLLLDGSVCAGHLGANPHRSGRVLDSVI